MALLSTKHGIVKTAVRVVVFLEDGSTIVIKKPENEQYVLVSTFAEREDATAAARTIDLMKRKRADKNYQPPGTMPLLDQNLLKQLDEAQVSDLT
jgi:hypothetical protein